MKNVLKLIFKCLSEGVVLFLTKELSQDPYYEKAKNMSPDPPVQLDGNIWVL